MLLVVFYSWNFFELSFFGRTILDMDPLWQLDSVLMRNTLNIIGKLFFFVFLPCIFIIRFPIEICNYIIKRISIWLAMRLRICSHRYPQTCARSLNWTAGDRLGSGRTATPSASPQKAVLAVYLLSWHAQCDNFQSEKRETGPGQRAFPSSVTKSSENCLHIFKN